MMENKFNTHTDENGHKKCSHETIKWGFNNYKIA